MPKRFYTTVDGTTLNADLLRAVLEEIILTRAIKACQTLRVTLPPAPFFKP